ncbi:MAG: type III polyketide synthase [Planctomycetota bacterium]
MAVALPPDAATQADYATAAAPCLSPDSATTDKQARALQRLYRRANVRKRHSVLLADGPMSAYYPPPGSKPTVCNRGPTTADRMATFARLAPPLAERAARDALTRAHLPPDAITQLVLVTCTGYHSPGTDLHLIHALNLPPTTGRTQLGFMGCHGALSGLRVAHALTQAGHTTLLVCVELCTLHFQYGSKPDHLTANALFADAAAATILTPHPPPHASPSDLPPTNYNLPPLSYTAATSHILPDSTGAMAWTITDHGFSMSLSPRVPDLIAKHLRPALIPFLAQHDLTLNDIATFAIHPGGPRVLDAVEHAIDPHHKRPGLADPSRHILHNFGNCSSPTVLMILDHLQHTHPPPSPYLKPGGGTPGLASPLTPCLALAFGPGLTLEAALLT